MPYYVSMVDRRVASTKGPCFTFEALKPILINENDATIPDVEAAGCITVNQLKEALANMDDLDSFIEPEPAPLTVADPNLDVLGEDTDIEGELRELRYAERIRKEQWDAAIAKEEAEEALKLAKEEVEAAKVEKAGLEAEKSPVYDQVVFEAAVHEILNAGDTSLLTPKGFPKAAAVKKITGFDVTPIKVVRYCKSLEE